MSSSYKTIMFSNDVNIFPLKEINSSSSKIFMVFIKNKYVNVVYLLIRSWALHHCTSHDNHCGTHKE